MAKEKIKKKNKVVEKSKIKVKGNSVGRIKWQPKRIYLVPKEIIVEEKEKLICELAQIVFEMNQLFKLNTAEAYEKE